MREKVEIPDTVVRQMFTRLEFGPMVGVEQWEAMKMAARFLLQEVVGGRVKLPGEKARGQMELFVGEKQSVWAGFVLTDRPVPNQPPTFIALHQEEEASHG